MLDTVVLICLGIISLAMVLTFVRLVRGPDLPDRILALDTLYMDSNLFFEAALLIAVMGFVSTVAIAKHLLRGNIIE